MGRLSVIALAAVFCLVGAAAAQNQFTLLYNPADGSASLQNATSSNATLIGYQVTSTGGDLIPVFNSATGIGWNSLADQGLGGFAEGGAVSSNFIGEISLSGLTLPANAKQSIGRPIQAGTSVDDLTFEFSVTGSGSLQGSITVIPEPATMTLLSAAGAGLAAVRRRMAK